MKAEKTRVEFPKSKISMTILEFGEPLFAQFPEIPPIDVLRHALQIVITVWNAHTLATPTWGQPHHLDDMKRRLCGPDSTPWMAAVVAKLTARRYERFKNDPRAVGEWSVRQEGDGLVFRCDARLPASVLAERPKSSPGRSRRARADARAWGSGTLRPQAGKPPGDR